jgi:drug/metabolite transporter (DMT)-like permease
MKYGTSILLILSATIGYGLMPIFTKIAFAAAIQPISLVFLRFGGAALFLWAFHLSRRNKNPRTDKKAVLRIAINIGIPITLTILVKFIAFTTMPVGVVQAIFYGYPLIVMLLAILAGKESFKLSNFIGYLIIFIGIILTLDLSDARITIMGTVLSVSSAFLYAWYILSIKHKEIMPVSGTMITTIAMTTGMVLMLIILPFTPQRPFSFDPSGWWGIAGLVFISSIGALVAFNRGAKNIDSSLAAIICCFEPIVTIVFELIFLEGFYSLRQYIGICLIPLGITFSLSFSRMRTNYKSLSTQNTQ